jgi:hypothetical protein
MRKMISYKIENLNPKERAIVDEWANGQFNIQQSLTNIIMHIVGFVGNVDVMDFDIQKQLHVTLGNSQPQVFHVKHDEQHDTTHYDKEKTMITTEIPTDKSPKRKVINDEFPDIEDIFPDD